MQRKLLFSWLLRVFAATIMVQTLYFKFTAQLESIYIFSEVGIEPWGRIATGIAELIASVLLIIPATVSIGAIMAIGIMTGAIITHLAILGVEVQGDRGQLFYFALTVLVSSLVLVVIHYRQLFIFKKLLIK